jgi:hypothetical protein
VLGRLTKHWPETHHDRPARSCLRVVPGPHIAAGVTTKNQICSSGSQHRSKRQIVGSWTPTGRTRPTGVGPSEIVALEQPFAACGKLPEMSNPPRRIVPAILWLLLLLTGVLLLISRGPSEAPLFSTLTAFTCDPQPVYQSGWMRGQRSPLLYVCKSGNQVLYQRSSIRTTGRFSAWRSCGRANGVITIWRHGNPSPYGSYIFQSACGDEIYASYAAQSANYNAAQTSGAIIAWSLVILSAGRLAVSSYQWIRRGKLKEGVSAI